MMESCEKTLEVKDETTTTPRFFMVGVFSIFYLILALLGPVNIFDGELLGTDSYTRLNRVLFVYEEGHWNQSIYPRSNAPYGESIHWTKPMDFLLLGGGALFALFMPFSTGLHVWGVVISPLLHVIAFIGVFSLMKEKLDRLGMILLSIVFLLQPILISYFMIGRPDHHSLILAVFCWFLVGFYKKPHGILSFRQAWFIGGMGALGLWVSVEFLVPIGLLLVAYTLCWIWQGDKYACNISRIMSALTLFSIVFLVIERSDGELFSIEYDRISLAHCVLMGFIALVWVGINRLDLSSEGTSSICWRLGLIGVMGIVFGVMYWALFPGFFNGPLVGMDPAIRQLIWDNVAETQPLDISDAIMNLGISIVVFPLLVYALWKRNYVTDAWQGIILIIGASIFIPLGLYEARWTPYASIILLIPYVEYVRRILGWIGSRWSTKNEEFLTLVLGLVLLFWPITVGTVVAFDQPAIEVSTLSGKCPLRPLTEYLKDQESTGSNSKTILAFKDFGPELLYRTSHRVIATPMHRNHDGLRDMLAIMKARDLSVAESLVYDRNIDLIVLCNNSNEEAEIFGRVLGGETFYDSLVEKNLPTSWLSEVSLPSHLVESFSVFEVKKRKG